jgi:repressor LexA
MSFLTKRQKELLDYIEEFKEQSGIAPSYREIGLHFKLSSLGSVYKQIKLLENRGFLTKEKNTPRSLQTNKILNPSPSSQTEVPFIGKVSVEKALELFVETKSITIPLNIIKDLSNTYVLQIAGNGFTEDHLLDEDFLIVEATSSVIDGQTIIALVNKQDTVIKKIYENIDFIRLEASNPSYQPLFIRKENIEIQGIVLGVFRLLR